MCKERCGADREPANPRQARIWRKRFFDNHGSWPKSANMSKKQFKKTETRVEPSKPVKEEPKAPEYKQDTLFDMPESPSKYYLNH